VSPQAPDSDWIVPPAPFSGHVNLIDYDPTWAAQYDEVAARIRDAIGDTAVILEHAGSTSVPGLAAKNQIDVVLGVPDSTDEAAYVPALEAAGFQFAIREPDWFEHRLFRGTTPPKTNLHVFSADCDEIGRMLAFRDWLRAHAEDRELYEREKRRLAEQTWPTMQDYADAKTDVVREIVGRALAREQTDVHGERVREARP
jgi:GrpB-like predicted nucleotidyltransferase (UPF0157 family)